MGAAVRGEMIRIGCADTARHLLGEVIMKAYSSKSNAKQAAHRSLGKAAIEGKHFVLALVDGKWGFDTVEREAGRGKLAGLER